MRILRRVYLRNELKARQANKKNAHRNDKNCIWSQLRDKSRTFLNKPLTDLCVAFGDAHPPCSLASPIFFRSRWAIIIYSRPCPAPPVRGQQKRSPRFCLTFNCKFHVLIIANGNNTSKVVIVKCVIMPKKMSTIAKNIKKYRTRLGISQDKLSKLAGITLHTITKIESGATSDPRIETVKKIANALGVSIDDLIKK